MPFNSMAQLKNRTWPSREAAVKELKRNGFKPRGQDYELRENSPGSWLIMELDAASETAPPAAAMNGTVVKLPTKAAKAKGKGAKAPEPAPVMEVSVTQQEDAATMLGLLNRDAPVVDAPVVDAVVPEPENDLSPLPSEGGPYYIRLAWPQFAILTAAHEVGRAFDLTSVDITDKTGKVVRSIDPRIGGAKPAKKKRGSTRSPTPAPRRSGAKAGDEAMAVEILALAKRKQGVKRTEMSALNGGVVINWKGYLERLGKRNGGLVVSVNKDGPTPIYWLK
jgi:hypothetical protein